MKSLSLLFSILATLVAHAAEKPASGHHDHAPSGGVRSLDVSPDGEHLHLLTGESRPGEAHPALLHRHSDDGGRQWSEPVRVDAGRPPAFGLRRGMDAQIAARGKQLIAVWTTAGTDRWGSGPLVTAISGDGGKTWRSGPNPADDGATTGHGFIDLAADRTGAFHLCWLDGRDGSQGLRYARSSDGGATWSANVTAAAATCECCANTLTHGPDGAVRILFRDRDPRDMRVATLDKGGTTWQRSALLGGFGWKFDGCPHVGGGLAFGPGPVWHAVVWTGLAGQAGVYHLASRDGARSWAKAQRLAGDTASHPDTAVDHAGRVAAVWDARADGRSAIWAATSRDGVAWAQPTRLSAPDRSAGQPRIVSLGEGFRVFWTETQPDGTDRWQSAPLAPRNP